MVCGDCQVAGDTEVKAQIRLQFRDITGQKCMVIRSLLATQKVIFSFRSMSILHGDTSRVYSSQSYHLTVFHLVTSES